MQNDFTFPNTPAPPAQPDAGTLARALALADDMPPEVLAAVAVIRAWIYGPPTSHQAPDADAGAPADAEGGPR